MRKNTLKRTHTQIIASLFIAAVLLAGSSVAYALERTQSSLTFSYATADISVTSPLKVTFSQEIDVLLHATLDQPIPGRWERVKGAFGLKAIIFHPRSRLEAGKTYQLTLSNLKRPFTGELIAAKKVIQFNTQPPAAVQSFTPANSATQVLTTSALQLVLQHQNHGLRRLELAIDPAVPARFVANPDDRTFHWKFLRPLSQGTTYKVSVDDININPADPRRRIVSSTFTTVTEPAITGTQRGYFMPGEVITIDFDQPMKSNATSFKFEAAGAGRWSSPTRYEYRPTSLKPGTTYTYSVLKGATSQAGGVTTSDRTFHISTPGHVAVTGTSPGGSGASRTASIRFTFDQAVDRASAEARFSLSPGSAGAFSWSGNTLIYTPAPLGYQTTYTATIGPGVQPAFGLPSTRSFSTTFTTELQVTRLGVPFFYQPFKLSCEETDLRMVLAYRGINTSEADIVARVGYNPHARDTANNFWDNPYEMFVGDINGKQNSTGYGVYAGPIAKAAQSYGRGAIVQTGVSAATVAAQIRGGNPVIIWGSSTTPQLDSWNTPTGPVQAWIGEHTRVVVGVVGRTEAPSGFYVHDSVYGANLYWTAGQLTATLNSVGSLSNQIVVVY